LDLAVLSALLVIIGQQQMIGEEGGQPSELRKIVREQPQAEEQFKLDGEHQQPASVEPSFSKIGSVAN
jgi:hypothetical protein